MKNSDQTYPDHYPVLLSEVLQHLDVKEGGVYLDCTFGAGGYSLGILKQKDCRLISLDQDKNVLPIAKNIKKNFPSNFQFIQTNFADAINKLQGNKFDGIVLDLGVSSMQIDNPERGFSFMQDGPLDMRMSSEGLSALEFINSADEAEIANVIYKYGEEVQSRQIAKAIVEYRHTKKITRTLELAEIVRCAMHFRPGKIDPATKTFQAIRIHVNQELASLEKLLLDTKFLLKDTGKLVVVSFHSLEDSIVKNFFKNHSYPKVARSKYSKEALFPKDGSDFWLQTITKKPIIPTKEEIKQNVRSRSAKMRVAQKIGGHNVD